jgi:hypothetical protein
MAGVRFKQFLNQGSGVTRRPLGQVTSLTYFQNGVELQFTVDPSVKTGYRNLRPLQWAGTESIWVKDGPVLGGKWRKYKSGPGTGSDNPESVNVVSTGTVIAYWDSPGPNVASFLAMNPSQIYVVQNFTGWIAGDAVSGGKVAERLCDVAAWHSVINLGNTAWSTKNAVPKWQRVNGSRSGTGWVDPLVPPVV